MENLVRAIKRALGSENWHAALFMVMTLPDIAAGYEYPTLSGIGKAGERYRKWFTDHLEIHYLKKIGASQKPHSFMTAEDFYSLRCAILHEGTDNVRPKREAVLSKFDFLVCPENVTIHNNSSPDCTRLNLQIDVLCGQIIEGVMSWWGSLTPDEQLSINAQLVQINFYNGSLEAVRG